MIGIDSGRDTDLFGVAMKPDIVVGSAERLALFADCSADSVFSSHTLEHIDHWQAADAMIEHDLGSVTNAVARHEADQLL